MQVQSLPSMSKLIDNHLVTDMSFWKISLEIFWSRNQLSGFSGATEYRGYFIHFKINVSRNQFKIIKKRFLDARELCYEKGLIKVHPITSVNLWLPTIDHHIFFF